LTTISLPPYLEKQAYQYRLDKAREKAKHAAAPNDITLTDFKRTLHKRYQHAAHLQALDEHLTQVSRYVETGGAEGIGFLIIEMPPRHGKSFTLSRFYPAWHLGRNPDHRVILASYGQSLVDKFSRQARNLIKSPLYQSVFPNIQLAKDSHSVHAWDLEGHDGGMDAMGIFGAATGKGAHILICDDLIEGREEAESLTIREKTWLSFTDDLLTRLEPGGAVILNATRWHVDDPTGRALKELKEVFGAHMVRLRMPAIAENDDQLGRAEGAALWEARYPIGILRRIEATLHEYAFSSLYQQNPMPKSAGVFDTSKLKYVKQAPHCIRQARFYDLAVSEKATADYTAGVRMGITANGEPVIFHMFRRQANPATTGASIISNALLDGYDVPIVLEAENSARVQLDYLLREPQLHHYNMSLQPIEGDKFTRALPFAARVNAGMCYVVEGDWNRDFVDELSAFNQGRYDDQVDACSGAWKALDNADTMTIEHFD
jgi:predicted phage terminase large subunit-like protein